MHSEVRKFVEHNPVFMLANIGEDGLPKNRAMITLGIYNEKLWFAVTKDKSVYKELVKDNNIELCAVTLSRWIRISGKVVFETDKSIIKHVLENSDIMETFYKNKDQSKEDIEVFYIDITHGMLEDYDTKSRIDF